MYSRACQRVHRLTRLPTLALPATAPTQRIVEVRNQLADCVGSDDGIGVDADIKLLGQPVEGEVQRGRLAPVGLGQHLNASIGDLGRIGLARRLGRAVARAVVDDKDAQIRVVGVEHRADGAHDDLLLVVGGNQNGDAWQHAGSGFTVRAAQAVDDGQNADQHQTRAHQDVAEKEDHHDGLADDGQARKGNRIGQGAQVARAESLGITSSVVLPSSAETATIV